MLHRFSRYEQGKAKTVTVVIGGDTREELLAAIDYARTMVERGGNVSGTISGASYNLSVVSNGQDLEDLHEDALYDNADFDREVKRRARRDKARQTLAELEALTKGERALLYRLSEDTYGKYLTKTNQKVGESLIAKGLIAKVFDDSNLVRLTDTGQQRVHLESLADI